MEIHERGHMIEWIYSGTDPANISRTTGHIGQIWTGGAKSWTGQIYIKKAKQHQFSGILFFTKVKIFDRTKSWKSFSGDKNLKNDLGFLMTSIINIFGFPILGGFCENQKC